MSLINEALKKAQKVRMSEPMEEAPPMPGGSGRVEKRGQPRSTSSLMVLVAGGVVLVVLSVVATVYLVNRGPEAKPVVAATKSPAANPTGATAANPVSNAPLIKVPMDSPHPDSPAPATVVQAAPVPRSPVVATPPPASEIKAPLAPEPKPTPAAPTPTAPTENSATRVAASAPLPAAPIATPAAESPSAAQPAASPVVPAKPDERVHQFVDTIRVTGIRSSGAESKVLMNDHVYRVNDIVDRVLGLRLTKVAAESLTFTDSNGVEYVRNF